MNEFKKVHANGIIPERQTDGAAGFDLHVVKPYVIPSRDRLLVETGIACAISTGCFGLIKPRSSQALKGLTVDAGVIDEDYRGEVMVMLVNNSDRDIIVSEGERVAQLIVVPYIGSSKEVDELTPTRRADGGFGSTGK